MLLKDPNLKVTEILQSPRLKRSGTKTVPDALPHKLDPKKFFPPFPV
jgi:hypothetical protein